MRNLILVIVFTSVLLSSCTLEQSVGVLGAIGNIGSPSPSIGSGHWTSTNSGTSTNTAPKWSSDALFIVADNWSTNNDPLFLNPLEFKEDVIFSGHKTKSINPNNGSTNWEIDVNFASSLSKQIYVKDKIVAVKNDKIYIVDLEQGQVQTVYKWPIEKEHLSTSFEVFDGRLYIALQNSHEGYSAIASCELATLSDAKWSYHFLENASIEFRGCDDIFRVCKDNLIPNSSSPLITNHNDIFLYFTGKKDGSYGTRYLEKYNLSQDRSEWFHENTNSINQIGYYESNILLGTDNSIQALDNNGTEIWRNDFNGVRLSQEFDSEFIIVNDLIVVLGSYNTFAIDLVSGDQQWKLSLPYSNSSGTAAYHNYQFLAGFTSKSLNIFQDKLYYLSNAGQLMIVDLSTGTYDSAILGTGGNFKNNHLLVTSRGTVFTGSQGRGVLTFPVPL